MLEPCDARVSRTVPRGLDDRKVVRLLGRNAKGITWQNRSGELEHFAFSGITNTGSAPYATPRSPGSRGGVSIIASPACWVVPRGQITAFWLIQSATTGFTASAFSYHHRVSLKEPFEGL